MASMIKGEARHGTWCFGLALAASAADTLVLSGCNDNEVFVSHMAPHHQGAIDMAQVELKYGKDPTLRQLATRIVAAQRDEIALMERWQKAHGATP